MSKVTKVTAVPKGEIEKYQSENHEIIQKAEAFKIKVVADEDQAHDILKEVKERLKFLDKKRKEITQPLNKSLKSANAMFKELSEPLKEVDGIMRNKILAFHKAQEAKAEKREQRLIAKQEAAEKAGDEDRVEAIQEKIEDVRPNVGSTTVQKRWTFEVVDIKKVPFEYFVLDEKMVREEIRNGLRDIPGIRIFQTENVMVR